MAENSYFADAKRRVKLYFLNDELQWEDRGTGYVSIRTMMTEKGSGPTIYVQSEEDGMPRLRNKLSNVLKDSN